VGTGEQRPQSAASLGCQLVGRIMIRRYDVMNRQDGGLRRSLPSGRRFARTRRAPSRPTRWKCPVARNRDRSSCFGSWHQRAVFGAVSDKFFHNKFFHN